MLIAGRYRLHEAVGTGGMGRVWMARDEMLDRDVAVKEFVPPDWMTDDEKNRLRTRTLREARSAARLNHPHVVRIYDVVHAEDLPWIVMEYVPSRSLYQVIGEDGPYPPVEAARIGLDVLDALTAAHRAGVLHRDVKPHNVLIGTDGRVVLTDFGLATFVDDGSVTSPGLIVGSPQYVSPERARDGASTVESDLWSLGATLYAAVEGRSPYARDSAMATLMALASAQPDPTRLAGPLAPVLHGLLQREPADRLTGEEVEAGLRAVLDNAGVLPANRRVVLPSPRRPAERPEPGAGVPASPQRPETGGNAAAALAAPKVVRRPEDLPLPPATAIRRANQAPSVARRPPAARNVPISPAAVLPAAIELAPPSPPSHDEAPPAAEREQPPRRSHTQLAIAGAALVALFAVGGAGYAVWRNGGGDQNAQVSPTLSTHSGGQGAGNFSPSLCADKPGTNLPQTPQPGAARTVGDLELLPGFSYFTDPTSGFHVAVPDGWTYETVGTTVCFRDPSNIRYLSVDPARNPAGDPVKACQNEAKRLVAAGELPAYKELSIDKVPLQSNAADWEYQYEGPNGLPMHAMTRWFTAGGKAFALGWSTREFDWPINSSTYSMIKSTFYVNQPFGKRSVPKASASTIAGSTVGSKAGSKPSSKVSSEASPTR
jgi:serine/threonine protein kinase